MTRRKEKQESRNHQPKIVSRICVFCGSTTNLTRHHIFEKHFYPDSKEILILCKHCHQQFHAIQNQFLFRLVKDGLLNYRKKIHGIQSQVIIKKLRLWCIEISLKLHFK